MSNKRYYVYILSSYRGTLYIGFTGNLAQRVEQHRTGLIKGFSKTYRTTRLVYYEIADNPEAGIAREKQLKSWRRDKKVMLIELLNPYWQELSHLIG